jgi:hypothetical protein
MLHHLLRLPTLYDFLQGYDDVKLYNMGLFNDLRESDLVELREFLQMHLTFPVQVAKLDYRERPWRSYWTDGGAAYVYQAALSGRVDVIRWAKVHGLDLVSTWARGAIQCQVSTRPTMLAMIREAGYFLRENITTAAQCGDFELVMEIGAHAYGRPTIVMEAAKRGRVDVVSWVIEGTTNASRLELEDYALSACYGSETFQMLIDRGYCPALRTVQRAIELGDVEIALDRLWELRRNYCTCDVVMVPAIKSNRLDVFKAMLTECDMVRPSDLKLFQQSMQYDSDVITRHLANRVRAMYGLDVDAHIALAEFGDLDLLNSLCQRTSCGLYCRYCFPICETAIRKGHMHVFVWVWRHVGVHYSSDEDKWEEELNEIIQMTLTFGRMDMLTHARTTRTAAYMGVISTKVETILGATAPVLTCLEHGQVDMAMWLFPDFPYKILSSELKTFAMNLIDDADRNRKLAVLLRLYDMSTSRVG